MKSNEFSLFLITLLSLTIGYLVGANTDIFKWNSKQSDSGIERLSRLIDYLEDEYVDPVDTDSLVGRVIGDIVSKLDPHSAYIPVEQQEALAESMQGNFYGIGVSFQMIRDTIAVVRVLKDGPSEKAGLLTGDRILMADSDTLYQRALSDKSIVKRLKGPSKSPLRLQVYRAATDSIYEFNFTRGAVPLPSVNAYYMLNAETGYMKINRFSQTTFSEFTSALRNLKSQNLKQLILDLRGNPGGYLMPATQIADSFLEQGQAIVIVESNKGQREQTVATANGLFETGALYILVDEESASASEVVAGAVQDNDRGWIVGRRTFGKGLVQQQMPLGKGDQIRLTTARYYTPTGRSIQRPYTENNNELYYAEVQQRYASGEMRDENNIPLNDSLKYTTPGGRLVYGGGGITPDFYVPNSNSPEEQWNDFILRSNLVNRFVFRELDRNRKVYTGLNKVQFFHEPLRDTDGFVDKFKQFCAENGYTLEYQPGDKETLLRSIKAYMALQLFDESVYIRIVNQGDSFIQSAVEALNRQ